MFGLSNVYGWCTTNSSSKIFLNIVLSLSWIVRGKTQVSTYGTIGLNPAGVSGYSTFKVFKPNYTTWSYLLNNHVYTPCFLSYWNGTGAFGRWSNLVIIFNKDLNGMETDKTRNLHSPINWKRKEGHVSTLLAVQEDRDRLEEKPDVHCWKRKKRK